MGIHLSFIHDIVKNINNKKNNGGSDAGLEVDGKGNIEVSVWRAFGRCDVLFGFNVIN